MNIVILAGGAGTRLWPMSSKQQPKQFQKLVSERTMLQETFDRVAFAGTENIYVSTNAEYVDLVREQLPEIPEEQIIAEPSMQDTGPCIGLAAALIAKKDPQGVMAVVYADHLVQDTAEFQSMLEAASQLARDENTLNIIEVRAKAPNTNLGYVKIGPELSQVIGLPVHGLEAFKEKPDLETAKAFLEDGNYLWNTGYYVWRVDKILEAFEAHLPQTHEQLVAIQNGGSIAQHYPQCDRISIDYGIMEKVDPASVRILPADLGWSDIGTWSSLHEELAKDPTANVSKGQVLAVESQGCLIYNEGEGLVSTLGLEDMIVVQVQGHTLICPKNRSADLKTLIKELHVRTDSNASDS